jgi:uncharacterized membrane protein
MPLKRCTLIKIIKRIINYTQHKTIVVKEEEEEITDEIEKSLWELKQKYDFDTEEISVVVKDYKNRSFNNKNK